MDKRAIWSLAAHSSFLRIRAVDATRFATTQLQVVASPGESALRKSVKNLFRATMRVFHFAQLLALAAAPEVHAADNQSCSDETVTAIARWAGIASARIATRDADRLVVASACKAMPNAPETTIAAVAFDSLPKSKNPDESKKLQVVALVEGGKVVAADRSVVEEDAATEIGASSYRIDTAPYRLSPDVRAFGVVFTSSARGPSSPMPTPATS